MIATHRHGDHVGSLNAVIARAKDADVFAGDLDVSEIASDRPITPLFDGDVGLFSGDALNGAGGGVVGPNPRFTPEMGTAFESVKKLATFTYEQVFFGHGEPVLVGGSDAVKALADSL